MSTLRASTYLADGANQLFDRWLQDLSDAGIELVRSTGGDQPFDAAVVFACGLLTIQRITDGAQREVVARPVFAGEALSVYRSVIIARSDRNLEALSDAEGLRLAVNEYGSWSGWHGLKRHFRQRQLPAGTIDEDCVLTGGHMRSIDAVLDGRADIAGIDHTVWQYRTATDSRCDELVVIDTTDDWPAPPLSISTTLPTATRDEIALAILSLDDIEPAALSDYDGMLAESLLTSDLQQ